MYKKIIVIFQILFTIIGSNLKLQHALELFKIIYLLRKVCESRYKLIAIISINPTKGDPYQGVIKVDVRYSVSRSSKIFIIILLRGISRQDFTDILFKHYYISTDTV